MYCDNNADESSWQVCCHGIAWIPTESRTIILSLRDVYLLLYVLFQTDDIFVWKLDQVKKSYPLRKDRKQVQRYSQ